MKNRLRLLVAALLLWAGTSLAQGYRVVDVMPDYWKFDAQAQGLDENARLQLFRELVVQRHPELYNARVIGLPGDKPFDQELARRFARVNRLTAGKAPLMRKLSDSIAADLPRYEAKFRESFPDFDYKGDVYFMHSLGGFDGGTRKVAGKTALLFGIDMIAYVYGTDVDPQPFFHHELFHLYQDQFPGNGMRSRKLVGSLWREGLATYVAHALNPQANGVSIFGIPRSTPDRVNANLPQVAKGIHALLDSTDRKDYTRYFMGAAENARIPQRSGYYVGYLVAEKIAKNHTLAQMARLPFPQARIEIDRALTELESGR